MTEVVSALKRSTVIADDLMNERSGLRRSGGLDRVTLLDERNGIGQTLG